MSSAEVEFEMGFSEDARSYTERMFFDSVDGEMVRKKTVRIDCSDGVPDNLPEGEICLLVNFKKNIARGRKDPLKGRDVLAIPADKGRIFLPFDEALRAASFLFSYTTSLKKTLESSEPDDIDVEPKLVSA